MTDNALWLGLAVVWAVLVIALLAFGQVQLAGLLLGSPIALLVMRVIGMV